MEAFIPSSFLTRQGVVRDVPKDMSENEILENLEISFPLGPIKVINIKRFSKKITNENKEISLVPIMFISLYKNINNYYRVKSSVSIVVGRTVLVLPEANFFPLRKPKTIL